MVRSFRKDPIPHDVFHRCVELASRAPSAGKTQGWHLLVWQGEETSRYWDITLPEEKRTGFAFPQLLDAPTVGLVLADPQAYVERYAEPDKAVTGLGESTEAWVAPYWTIDASFATMTLLLALEDSGVGALFFAHAQEETLRTEFGIPPHIQILGTVAMGYESDVPGRTGRSAKRHRRTPESIIHEGNW